MTREIRLGMIGCGEISGRFFEQATRLGSAGWGTRFVATCAAHEASARATAERHGCARWYDDHRRLLDDPEVDAVVIATPHPLHAGMAVDALARGKHVLLEKPMATTWEQAVALREAAARSDARLMALPFTSDPTLRRLVELATEGVLGKITGAEAYVSFPGPPRSNWYYAAEAGGGAMIDSLVYPLARLAAVMGPAARVTALCNRLIPHRKTGDGGQVESGVDDNVSMLLEYATGQHAQLHSSWARSYMQQRFVLHGRHGAIFADTFANTLPMFPQGSPLVVKSDLGPPPGGEPFAFDGIPNTYRVAVPPMRVEDDILAHFLEGIRGARIHCGIDVGVHIVEQQQRAYQSARERRTLELESTFELWWPREPSIMDLSRGWI
jgi:predicted dehydrogenase